MTSVVCVSFEMNKRMDQRTGQISFIEYFSIHYSECLMTNWHFIFCFYLYFSLFLFVSLYPSFDSIFEFLALPMTRCLFLILRILKFLYSMLARSACLHQCKHLFSNQTFGFTEHSVVFPLRNKEFCEQILSRRVGHKNTQFAGPELIKLFVVLMARTLFSFALLYIENAHPHTHSLAHTHIHQRFIYTRNERNPNTMNAKYTQNTHTTIIIITITTDKQRGGQDQMNCGCKKTSETSKISRSWKRYKDKSHSDGGKRRRKIR